MLEYTVENMFDKEEFNTYAIINRTSQYALKHPPEKLSRLQISAGQL